MIKVPLLYHGTDARIVEMSSTERQQYLKKCRQVVDYLFPFYNELASTFETVEKLYCGQKIYTQESLLKIKYGDKLKSIPGLYYNLNEKITMMQAQMNGNKQYQYGSFYLTSDRRIAFNYAVDSFAGGELGLVAYRFIQGLDIVVFDNFNPSTELLQSIKTIQDFASDEQQDNPVIFTFKDIDIADLLDEEGNRLASDFNFKFGRSFRYLKDVHLSLENAEFLKRQ